MSYVLILEQDPSTLDFAGETLASAGYLVRAETDTGTGIRLVMSGTPWAIVVAEDMPPVGSIELLPLLRRLTPSPILVLGAGGERAVVKALMEGADMYIKKPFDPTELLGRLKTLLRRSQSGELDMLAFTVLEADLISPMSQSKEHIYGETTSRRRGSVALVFLARHLPFIKKAASVPQTLTSAILTMGQTSLALLKAAVVADDFHTISVVIN